MADCREQDGQIPSPPAIAGRRERDGLTAERHRLRQRADVRRTPHDSPPTDGGGGGGPSRRRRAALSCREMIIITNVVTGDLIFSSVASMLVPFFPSEAEQRGVPQTAIGTVFSAHAATMLLMSPLNGRLIPTVGVCRIFQLGLALTGLATMALGLADWITDMRGFVAACAASRVAEALGTSAAYSAGCTIIANQFPERVNMLFALAETMFGVGMAAGPALGGVLYSVGGYSLPFYTLGGLTVAAAAVSWCSLPALDDAPRPVVAAPLLRSAEAWLNLAVLLIVSAGYTALRPGLAPFAAGRLDVDPSRLGLFFLVAGGVYAASGPIIGKLCDRVYNNYPMMAVFLVLAAVSLALFSPPPVFGVPASPTLLMLGMTLRELSLGGALIPTFGNLMRAATGAGMPATLAVQAFVSSVWATAFSMGSVIGPLAGGLLTGAYGFPTAVYVFGALMLLIAAPVLLMACHLWRRDGSATGRKDDRQDGTADQEKGDGKAAKTDRDHTELTETTPLLSTD